MPKYRKKPVVIDAFKTSLTEMIREEWFWNAVTKGDVVLSSLHSKGVFCTIQTLEGKMDAKFGDYIIRGVDGEMYPCRADIFEKTYEEVGE